MSEQFKKYSEENKKQAERDKEEEEKKHDDEVKKLASLINEATGGIKDKGFMYSLPIDFLEGIE